MTTRRAAILLSLCALAACAGPRRSGQEPAGPGAAVVFEKRSFPLVKTPDAELEAALEGLLSASYDTAVRIHSGDRPMEIGFTYSISPKGVVYPFSEIEVSCILQEKYARRSGPGLCGDFFRELGVKINRAVAAPGKAGPR